MKSKKICRLFGIGLLSVMMFISFIAAMSLTGKTAVIAETEKDLGYFNRSSDDVTVTEGFDLFNAGDYSSYVLTNGGYWLNQFNGGGTNITLRAEKGFSSYLTSDYSYEHLKTTLFETKNAYADAENATIRLIDNYNGAFSTMGMPMQSGGRDIALGDGDYTELAFIVSDKNDPENILELRLIDNGAGNCDMTVIYKNLPGETLTGLYGVGVETAFRSNASWVFPYLLKFDPVEKKVATGYRVNIEMNLAEKFPDITGFEEYSVDMVFRAIQTDTAKTTSDGKARFYMIELCGNTLYRESAGIHDETKPYISVPLVKDINDIYAEGTVTVPEATAYDMLSTAEITATAVTGPDGTEVVLNNNTFVPAKTGKYTVTYTATDSAATTHTAERSITFTIDALYEAETEIRTVNGAWIRCVGDGGLRFAAAGSVKEYEKLSANYTEVKYGMLIVPTKFLTAGTDFTVDTAKADKVEFDFNKRLEENGEYLFYVSEVEIPEANYGTKLSVRAFIKLTDSEGNVTYRYADYNEANHSRSIQEVAAATLDSGEIFDAETLILLNKFAGRQG